MGDEGRNQELPHRARDVARSGPAPSAPRVLPEEVLQRMRAAVKAERAHVSDQDKEHAPEAARREHASAPQANDAAGPAHSALGRVEKPQSPRTSERPARPEPPVDPGSEEGPASHEPAPATANRPERPARSRPGALAPPRRRRLSLAGVVAAALVVIATGSLAYAMTSSIARPPGPAGTASAALNRQELAELNRQELAGQGVAATWVVEQVSHAAVVSCDPAMCAALRSRGFPSRNLLALKPTSPYPRASAVVVETAVVRALFGSSLDTEWAPAVLASFGSGDGLITVRVVAPHGAAAYVVALAADLSYRKEAGVALLQVNRITVSPTARKQLSAGQVDSRLLLAIAALATDQPIDIVQFGNIGPGADVDMPLRFAYLATSDQAAHVTSSAYIRSIAADLGRVPAPANSAGTATVVLPGGQTVVAVKFTAPSPLGLLGPQLSH
jgi:hypothetical protein